MSNPAWIRVALFGAVGVMAGAFGSHALAERVSAARLETWQTAVRYLFFHLPVLLLLASGLLGRGRWVIWAERAFTLGLLIFSGSLFTLVLSDRSWLGAVTPLGGLSLIVGWCCLAGLARRPAAP